MFPKRQSGEYRIEFRCYLCNRYRVFRYLAELRDHVTRTHSSQASPNSQNDDDFRCYLCPNQPVYQNLEELRNHLLIHNRRAFSNNQNDDFRCYICPDQPVRRNLEELQQHLLIHNLQVTLYSEHH
ncbi:uncharacterized protein [Anoplolepis gracilipes]|uniref:uncharacterized protein n=1 Tax=Anoplolepis gracilipes TaxID=354296 RepID=UPI003B9FA370